jgi:hypothetical protein
MDTDGNGHVDNFDYIAIKLNWMKTHGAPRNGDRSDMNFSMSQNYPNPFSQATVIEYKTPELSDVCLIVTDMAGRIVATLINDRIEEGIHEANFNSGELPAGAYSACIIMKGVESGIVFKKTITMKTCR